MAQATSERGTKGTQLLRAAHRQQLVELLRVGGPLARSDVAERLGLTRSAVTSIVAGLIEEGTLHELDSTRPQVPTRGRPRVLVGLNPRAARVVGVQLGARLARVVLADAAGEVLARDAVPVAGLGSRAIVNRVVTCARGMIDARPGGPVATVGICVPGSVDTTTGTVLRSDVLGWEDVPIADLLSRGLGVPAFAQDVTQAATLAEALYGAAAGASDALVLDYGTRIGVGLIIGGRLHRGSSGLAGSIGHVAEPGSTTPCRCGRRGCLEANASIRAMVERSDVDPDQGPAGATAALLEGYRDGDVATRAVVDAVIDHIAHVTVMFAGLIDPEVLVVTGFVERFPEIAAALERRIGELTPVERAGRMQIRRSPLGDEAWVRGSVLVALQQVDPNMRRLFEGVT